ncbi:hypothetical protein HMPREF9554_01961 [Treponema phagedenis F0421]|nr:hypothetical protein HMPREF9554_01961 [Treponema phagedenis F0421]
MDGKNQNRQAGGGSNRNDVLKQSSLQSFKTRRFHFAMDGKMKPLCRALFNKIVYDLY